MYIVAFAVAYFLSKKQVHERRFPLSDDDLLGLFGWSILGLILGARIFHCLVYEPSGYYLTKPWLMFWPFRDGHFTGLAGMSYHGGVIGGLLGFGITCYVKKYDVREIADMFAASIPLGYTFGRLGNFINGELYGRVTTSPVAMIFPQATTFASSIPQAQAIANATGVSAVNGFYNLPRYPSQLFEALLEGVLLWAVIWSVRKYKPFRGFLTGLYVFGYGFIRFFIEYFREPDEDIGYRIQLGTPVGLNDIAFSHPLLSFSTGQILCFGMIVLAIIWWIIAARLPGSKAPYLYPEPEELEAEAEKEKKAEREEARRKARAIRKKLK
jgi:phosphatidylglycerol:prolipoprotein diacylglycerol transferase